MATVTRTWAKLEAGNAKCTADDDHAAWDPRQKKGPREQQTKAEASRNDASAAHVGEPRKKWCSYFKVSLDVLGSDRSTLVHQRRFCNLKATCVNLTVQNSFFLSVFLLPMSADVLVLCSSSIVIILSVDSNL